MKIQVSEHPDLPKFVALWRLASDRTTICLNLVSPGIEDAAQLSRGEIEAMHCHQGRVDAARNDEVRARDDFHRALRKAGFNPRYAEPIVARLAVTSHLSGNDRQRALVWLNRGPNPLFRDPVPKTRGKGRAAKRRRAR